MCSATATPTAPTPAGPAPARVSGEDAELFLAGVSGWVYKLAHEHHERVGLTVEDFAHELRASIFLHLHTYDAARGSRTNWVLWRCRNVVAALTKKRGRFASAVPFSQLGRMPDGDDGSPVEDMAVAPFDPDAEAGRLEREEEVAELQAGVRTALGRLPPARAADVSTYFGLGEDAGEDRRERKGRGQRKGRGVMTLREVAALRGVTHERVRQTVDAGLATLREDGRLQELASRHGLGIR